MASNTGLAHRQPRTRTRTTKVKVPFRYIWCRIGLAPPIRYIWWSWPQNLLGPRYGFNKQNFHLTTVCSIRERPLRLVTIVWAGIDDAGRLLAGARSAAVVTQSTGHGSRPSWTTFNGASPLLSRLRSQRSSFSVLPLMTAFTSKDCLRLVL